MYLIILFMIFGYYEFCKCKDIDNSSNEVFVDIEKETSTIVSKFMFDVGLVDKLKKYGHVAQFRASISNNSSYFMKSRKQNLRLKLWIALHKKYDYSNSNECLLTIMRIDNKVENPKYNKNYVDRKRPTDLLWTEVHGWSEDLYLILDNLNVRIKIRANNEFDVYQATLNIKGVDNSPIFIDKRSIPSVLYTIYGQHDNHRPPVLTKSMSTFQILNPHYELITVSVENMSQVLMKYNQTEYINAYNSLQPISYRTDLYRFVMLYHQGGVYFDSKIVCMIPLDEFLPMNTGFLLKDIGEFNIWTGFLSFPPKSQFLSLTINQLIENVRKKFYPPFRYGQLAITGPALLGKIARNHNISLLDGIEIKHKADHTFSFVVEIKESDELFITLHNAEYRRLYSGNNQCYYATQFKRRIVYYERECINKLGTQI